MCGVAAATPARAPTATPARSPVTTTTFVVAGTECGAVVAWEFRNDRLVLPPRVCVGHSAAVTALATSVRLDLVVSGSVDGTILLHALRSGDLVRRIRLADEGGARHAPFAALRALAFVLGGRIAALTSDELVLFDLNDGTVLAQRAVSGGGGGAGGSCDAAAASASASASASANANAAAEESDASDGGGTEEMLPQLVATRDGRFVLTAHRGAVQFRWAHTLRVARRVRHKPATSGAFASFALSPDERCIAVGTANGGHIVTHACHFGFCESISTAGDGGPYAAQRAAATAAAAAADGGRGSGGGGESGSVGDLLDFSGGGVPGAPGGGLALQRDLLDFGICSKSASTSAFAFIGGDNPAAAAAAHAPARPPALSAPLDPLTSLYASFASHTDRASPLIPAAAADAEAPAAPFAKTMLANAAAVCGGDKADPFAFAALDKLI